MRYHRFAGTAAALFVTSWIGNVYGDEPPTEQSSRPGASAETPAPAPVVDVVLHVTEGPRYTINRITFVGNSTIPDDVIRREMRLVEGAVFNTAALRESLTRLNQLGYFKPLEGTDRNVQVTKAAGREDAVDVTFTLEELNHNHLEYGGGISPSDGIFGTLSYTSTNLLGRSDSVRFFGQQGARSSTYQLSFTEPYLFGRMATGIDLFTNETSFTPATDLVGYREARTGINVAVSHALRKHSRASLAYVYERIDTAVGPSTLDIAFLDAGRHMESRITPAYVYDTRDDSFQPRHGRRIMARAAFAGGLLGGSTNYIRPEIEAVQYVPHTRRTALGLRFNAGWIRPLGATETAPYYLRYFLGGEDQIRGVDIRTVGPIDAANRAIGGDKFMLFNAEYYLDLNRRVRLVLFHDAGQAYSEAQPIDARQLRSSSGIELRVMLPKLNVPLRLIYGWNTDRDAFQPASAFKFALGFAF